jgi:SAM-dependent methyltransferase
MNLKSSRELSAYTYNEENFAKEDESKSLRYFDAQVIQSKKYWERLGGRPDFSGKVVLELGCGHGALSIDAALSGAEHVIGLDLMGSRIAFAKRIVAERFPNIANKIEFHKMDIADIDLTDKVDIVLSKDTFEHIMGLDEVLLSVRRVLREGGLLITAFSPLYYSPFGDHGFHAIGQRFKLPWGHLILGDARVVAAYNKYHKGVECHSVIECQSIYDLGLNKLKRRDFLQAFEQAGFTIIRETVNAVQGASKLMPLLNLVHKIPGLEDYTTVNMNVVLRKTEL